jgi:hypothetical protein
MPSPPIPLPPVPSGPDRPIILARVYPGYHEAAVELFQMDAELLTAHGYVPIGQSYAEGRWRTGLVVLAIVLCLVLIGLPLLAYMVAVRPPGSLAVSYELRGSASIQG